jgi:hypothetical protein
MRLVYFLCFKNSGWEIVVTEYKWSLTLFCLKLERKPVPMGMVKPCLIRYD